MTKRSFVVKDIGKVRYECGQPMGLLSSWAVFSLTHHAITEYAAWRIGLPAKNLYYMLGDDITILDTQVANEYLKIMKEIDVDISIPKSFISKRNDENRIAEFAKRIVVNGIDMSPVPAKLLDQTRKNIFMFPLLIKKLRELGRGLTPLGETRLCSQIYGVIPKLTALVMTAPQCVTGIEPWDINILKNYFNNKRSGNAPIEGFTFPVDQIDNEVVIRAWINVRIEHLLKAQESQTMKFMKTVSKDLPTHLVEQLERRGIPISLSIMKRESYNALDLHPLLNKIQQLHWTFWSVEEELRMMLEKCSDLTEEEIRELKLPEYMPQVDYSDFLGISQQEAKLRMSLIRRLHSKLADQVNLSTK
jgi:hypothetical protein